MFRSLLSLLFFVNAYAAPIQVPAEKPFDLVKLLKVEPIPNRQSEKAAPLNEARGALVMDLDTNLILYAKNAEVPMPMASLTKIMTAVVILDNHSLDETVRIKSVPQGDVGVRIWLKKGERFTVGDLLTALLVPSAGDAATALAEFHSGSVEKFVEAMNKKAAELSLTHTLFKNPVGIDEEGHYSTPFDLAILTKYALRYKAFRNIVKLSSASITSAEGSTYGFDNTNRLLGGPLNIQGVKTGTTEGAGASVINLARHPRGHEVLSIILNSPNRFPDSENLLNWSFQNFIW